MVFCTSCGTVCDQKNAFCHSCGTKLTKPSTTATATVTREGAVEGDIPIQPQVPPALVFDRFRQYAASKRQVFFSKKRPRKDTKASVSVGVVYLFGDRLIKSRAGEGCRGQILSVEVAKEATVQQIIDAAVEKQKLLSNKFKDGSYLLLHQDLTVVDKLPGSENLFILSQFRELFGKSWSKLRFFLVLKKEWEVYCSRVHDEEDEDDTHEDEDDSDLMRSPFADKAGGDDLNSRPTTVQNRSAVGNVPFAESDVLPDFAETKPRPRKITTITLLPKTTTTIQRDVPCPVCEHLVPQEDIQAHVERCLDRDDDASLQALGEPSTERRYAHLTSASNVADSAEEEISFDVGRGRSDSRCTAISVARDLATKTSPVGDNPTFNICRSSIWDGTVRGMMRKRFSPKNKLFIRFTDSIHQAEGAVDTGGPRKEFFRLVLEYIGLKLLKNTQITHLQKDIQENSYFFAGQLMVLSLAQGGPSPNMLSPVLVKYLLEEEITTEEMLPYIADEHKQKIVEVQQATGLGNILCVMTKHQDFFDLSGCYRPINTEQQKQSLIHDLCIWLLFERSQATEKLRKGLDTMGFISSLSLKVALDILSPHEVLLVPDTISAIFNIQRDVEGSNRFATEARVITYWLDFLQDIQDVESTISFKDILVFATGLERPPTLSFTPEPEITFLHDKIMPIVGFEYMSKYPLGNTCANVLRLPIVHDSYDDFKHAMEDGILQSPGFGMV